MNKSLLATALAGLLAVAAPAAEAVDIRLINLDTGLGLGLDDPAPRAPVGGNNGTTLGQQRLVAYQYAADLWSAVLAGNTPVRVTASFQPLACTPTGGTLASAGALSVLRDYTGAIPGTWYHVALAKGMLGQDVNAPAGNDIQTRFNGDIGVNPNCLTGSDWYYGLDGNTPAGQINFLNVVMHEIGHGLGFSGFENVTTGALFSGFPSIYANFSRDNTLGLGVRDMNNTQRAAAFINDGNLVWTGPRVTSEAALLLDRALVLRATAPAGIAGNEYEVAPGAFGGPVAVGTLAGNVVLADSGGATGSQGCTAFVNAAQVAGNVALVDRGTCPFVDKARNAQAAGATGVLMANNVAGLLSPGGAAPDVTIPVVGITLAAGTELRNAASPAVALATSNSRLQGADASGRVLLYAPLARAPGSTYSHFDVRLTPNALMEPFNTASLRANLTLDLTPALFADEGWPLDTGNARIGTCDTLVPMQGTGGLVVGAAVVAQSRACSLGAPNREAYVACMGAYANELLADGLIDTRQAGQIARCAVRQR
ncbi:MAG: hypothetical protein ABS41_00270 [Arenimonas sp. SCN 70-307]|uniref:PA domain-containing protein n=1 Tax=Arenimonas sp. SCN 70-307 TaxID=1660089 RepID=UPI00086B56D2|nr:PA domain-containing protein [Arenimonas sp. SCN 70-307]ODS64881.1 MAG: hypothetical protein ABS41_00270 [Arenimonas sp. SCN 70-307]